MLRHLARPNNPIKLSYAMRFFSTVHKSENFDRFYEFKIEKKENSKYNNIIKQLISKDYIERDYPLSLRNFRYDFPLNVKLRENIPTDTLLQGDFYTNDLLKKEGFIRLNTCMLLARAHKSASPDMILKNGFKPKSSRSGTNNSIKDPATNVISHQSGEVYGSGLVSFTPKMSCARNFIGFAPGILYIAKTTGAICNINPEEALFPQEFEYSVPGGVGPNDIIAFREHHIKNTSDDKELPNYSGPPDRTSIYICKQFMDEFPQHVRAVIKAYLFIGEDCENSPSVTNAYKNTR